MRLFLLICLICPSLIFGQKTKTTEQSFGVPSSKSATMNLQFAQNIKVNNWNKNEIVLKTTFKYREDNFEQWYDQQVDKSGGSLNIKTGFKNLESKKKNRYQCWGCENDNGDCYCLEFSYEVFAPSSIKLEIETISGDIEIPAWAGNIKVKSISGFIDLALSSRDKMDLNVKSVTGEIYTDLDAVVLDGKSTPWSKKINTSLNGGGDLVRLETVSGNIFLRKQ
ncbi:MAG: hypothetical protein AAF705_18495 [Bacteroidota bacterium]